MAHWWPPTTFLRSLPTQRYCWLAKWNWFRNELFIQSIWRDKYAIGGGISHDYLESKFDGVKTYSNPKNFVNTYVFIKTDTQDDKSFPSKGLFLHAEGKALDLLNDEQEGRTLQINHSKNYFKLD